MGTDDDVGTDGHGTARLDRDGMTPAGESAWRSRPRLSRGVRAVVYIVPIATALVASILLTRHLPRRDGVAPTLLWWVVVTVVTVAIVIAVERLAHRLLPLAALLNMSMVFPDQAPHRFQVARHLGRPADIRRRIEEAQANGIANTETATMQSVLELATALSVHDKRTRGHSERVRVFSDMIAEQMHLSSDDRARLRWASLLHDVGKLRVRFEVLNKPGRPDDEEWVELRRHPEEGARLAAPVVVWLGDWGKTIAQHHERWDGGGYPRGLTGEQICLGARIVAVADSFETMTAARAYRRPMRPEAARGELVRCSGTQFDPVVVRAFLEISLGKVGRAVGISAWVAQIPALTRVGPMLQQAGTTVASTMGAVAVTVGVAVGASPGGALPPPPQSPLAVAVVSYPSAGASTPGQPAATPAPPGPPDATPAPVLPVPTGTATLLPGQPTDPSSAGPSPRSTPGPTGAPTPRPTPAPTPPPDAAPVVTPPASGAVPEGSTYSATAGFNDSDSTSWTSSVAYGDGTIVNGTASGGAVHLSHTYTRWGSYTVTVTVTDNSGMSGVAQAAVSVSDVAPTFSLPTTTIHVDNGNNNMLSYSGTFVDPGSDTWTGTVVFVKGNQTITSLMSIDGAARTFSISQALQGGMWTGTVTITDSGGASATGTMTVQG